MAWRPTHRVESGELDNRVRGHVTGWIRLYGRAEPLRLDLCGDCHPDLAGWRFRIVRLEPVPEWAEAIELHGLAADQVGEVGDITADQFLRHFDCPVAELVARLRAGEPPPMELRQALYLEWYSARNGRVVIHDTRLGVERIGQRAFELADDELRQMSDDARRHLDALRQQGMIEEIDPHIRLIRGPVDRSQAVQSKVDRQPPGIRHAVKSSRSENQSLRGDDQDEGDSLANGITVD